MFSYPIGPREKKDDLSRWRLDGEFGPIAEARFREHLRRLYRDYRDFKIKPVNKDGSASWLRF